MVLWKVLCCYNRFVIGFFLFLTFFWFLFPSQAYAYLDPGTGSYIVQIIIASLVGGLYVFSSSWKGVKKVFERLFSKVFGREEVSPSDED